MDTLDVRKIRQLSDEEIQDKVDEQLEQLLTLRLQKATGELKDENLFRFTRRNIARLRTVITERQLAAELALEEEQATDG